MKLDFITNYGFEKKTQASFGKYPSFEYYIHKDLDIIFIDDFELKKYMFLTLNRFDRYGNFDIEYSFGLKKFNTNVSKSTLEDYVKSELFDRYNRFMKD